MNPRILGRCSFLRGLRWPCAQVHKQLELTLSCPRLFMLLLPSSPVRTQLIPVPRTPNVHQILDDYLTYATSSSNSTSTNSRQHISRSTSLIQEVISGLKIYFEKSIGSNLLYRFERGQYGELKRKYQASTLAPEERKEMGEIYGVEHLLRLFGESLTLCFFAFLWFLRLLGIFLSFLISVTSCLRQRCSPARALSLSLSLSLSHFKCCLSPLSRQQVR